jgi:hypothetical protein
MGWFMIRLSKAHKTIPVGGLAILALTFSLVWVLSAPGPAAADATVYRCGPPGSQWYSQIPCNEDSEAIVIKDQHKLGDSGNSPATSETQDSANEHAADSAADSANNAEAFITRLEKQRSEQLAEIDRNIASLQNQATEPAEGEETTATKEENTALLTSLQNTRESIVAEYDAMILAAQQRIAKP